MNFALSVTKLCEYVIIITFYISYIVVNMAFAVWFDYEQRPFQSNLDTDNSSTDY